MSVLRFDWEKVTGRPVAAVMCRNQREMSDGSVSWDELSLALDQGAVVLTVNADTDEIEVAYQPVLEGGSWEQAASLSHAVGKPLGWCWVGMNYRGYHDIFILAFGDMVPEALAPRLMFLGEGAAITCFDLNPVAG